MSNPLVTVLLPVYNAEKFLTQAIDSILGQTYKDFILLVINDGSVDGSESIIKEYNDPRIVYRKNNANLGLISTLNIGLSQVTTKYIIRMDADDVSHLERFRLLVEFMEQNPTFGICGTGVGDLEQDVTHIAIEREEIIWARHLLNCSITHASAIYRTSILRDYDIVYNEKYKHSEDNDLITNIMSVSRAAILNCRLYWVRKHENQVSHKYSDVQRNSSTLKRVELFKRVTNLDLSDHEVKLYRALSYKEAGLNLHDFKKLPEFIAKLFHGYSEQRGIYFDQKTFNRQLHERVFTLYVRNSGLGISLFFHFVFQFWNKRIAWRSIGLLRAIIRTRV